MIYRTSMASETLKNGLGTKNASRGYPSGAPSMTFGDHPPYIRVSCPRFKNSDE